MILFFIQEKKKDNNFYKGQIGTFIIIKAPNKLEYDYKNNKAKRKAKDIQKDAEFDKFI